MKFTIPSRDVYDDVLKDEVLDTDKVRVRLSDKPYDWIEISLIREENKNTDGDVIIVSSGWNIGITVSPRACNTFTIGKAIK